MIENFVNDVATLFGIDLQEVLLTGIPVLGQTNAYSLDISNNDCMVRTLIHQCEIDNLKSGIYGDLLTLEICTALEQLNTSSLHK